MEFMKNFGFQMSIYFRKIFQDFPKFFDKISNPENKTKSKFLEFVDKSKQMKLKIKCQKQLKKRRKQILNRKILKKKYFTYQYLTSTDRRN